MLQFLAANHDKAGLKLSEWDPLKRTTSNKEISVNLRVWDKSTPEKYPSQRGSGEAVRLNFRAHLVGISLLFRLLSWEDFSRLHGISHIKISQPY